MFNKFPIVMGGLSFKYTFIQDKTLMPLSDDPRVNSRPEDDVVTYCWNRDRLFNESMFHADACVRCYSYIPEDYFDNKKLKYSFWNPGCLHDNKTARRYCYKNGEEDIRKISDTFSNPKGIQLWTDCCEAAVRCCEKLSTTKRNDTTGHCAVE